MTTEQVVGYFYLRKAGLAPQARCKHTDLTEEQCTFIDAQRIPKGDIPCLRICTNIALRWNHTEAQG